MDENPFHEPIETLPLQLTVDLTQLRKELETRFNLGELQGLCFDAGLKYENVQGSTLSEKVTSLVELAVRHNQLLNLIQVCKHLRPDGNWGDSLTPPDSAPSVVAASESSQPPPERIQISDNSQSIKWQRCYSYVLIGMVIAGYLFLTLDQEFGFGLDSFFQPVITHDFNNERVPLGMRKAQSEYTSDIEIQTFLFFDSILKIDLAVPALVRGESVAEYGGGVCIPVDPETRYDAISAKVKVEDAKTFIATFWATNGEEWFLSGETILPSDRWTRLFWGTEFGHSAGDGQWSEWPIQGVKSNSPGVTEFCLWLYSEQAYQTSAFVDELTIYQRIQPLGN